MRICLLIFLAILSCCYLNPSEGTSIRDQFTTRFYDRCVKYSFVQKYIDTLENPHHKYLIFDYHKFRLRNGGFGDRLGGVITAFIHSLRYKRTLFLSAENGMHKLFRPFHPDFIPNPNVSDSTTTTTPTRRNKDEDIFFWDRWQEWSHFSEWKRNNSDYDTNPKPYEYLLNDCLDIEMTSFTPEQTKRCALDTVAVRKLNKYPIIRFASNRAYLCHYENRTDVPSHESVLSVLEIQKNQVDLFEVAGCMTRLVMWPTDLLWKKIDDFYQSSYVDLLKESPNDIYEAIEVEKNSNGKKSKKKSGTEKKPKVDKKELKKRIKKNKKVLTNYISVDLLLNRSTTVTPSVPNSINTKNENREDDDDENSQENDNNDNQPRQKAVLPYTLQGSPPFQIGLHVRCGDYWSYKDLLLHTNGYSRTGCIYDEEAADRDEAAPYSTDPTTLKRSYYLNAGNPKTLGECANGLVKQRENTLKLLSKTFSLFCFLFFFPLLLTEFFSQIRKVLPLVIAVLMWIPMASSLSLIIINRSIVFPRLL
jgi:hypothetical protein